MLRAAVIAVCLIGLVAADNRSLKNSDTCKGECRNVSKGCNGGNFVRWLCPGGKNMQCCVPSPVPAARTDNSGVGGPCGQGGVCQLSTTSCAGKFQSGLCPGKSNVQCCVPKADSPTPTPANPTTDAPVAWPKFDTLWQKYPHGEAADVKRRIGGGIDADYITNTCTIRVTRAMVMAGMKIDPSFVLGNGKKIFLVKGSDGNGLALRVAEFRQYMQRKFGKPAIRVVNAGDGTPTIPSQFNGRKGMIMFDVRVWDDATGHFDFWDGKACAHNCYFDKAREVWLWEIA